MTMRRLRKLPVLLAAWVVCALGGVASAPALAGPQPPQKIEFWTFSMKPKFTPYFEQLVQRYERDNPDVKVEWVDFPWDIIQTKLVTRIVAGLEWWLTPHLRGAPAPAPRLEAAHV